MFPFFVRLSASPFQEGELLSVAVVQLGAAMLGNFWWLLYCLFVFAIFSVGKFLSSQSHYMAEALEERATQEVVNSNVALEALQAEFEMVEAEKKQLAEEVVGLRSGQKDLDELKGKIESLSKALDGSKAVE